MADLPIALQLYTVRDDMEKDFAATLRRVAAIGYPGVEMAGFGGLSATQVKGLLDELGLCAVGAHVGLEAIEQDAPAVIAQHLEIGCRRLVVPWQPAAADRAGWVALAQRLNAAGAALQAHGLQLCYHNHAHEFVQVDGAYGLDLLYAETDPALVQAELDLYWVRKGGADPVEYVTRYAGRLPLLHCKDMAGDAEGAFTEFGTGILPWDAIFAAAQPAGVEWYIVEQDICARPCLESVEISFRNLRARLAP